MGEGNFLGFVPEQARVGLDLSEVTDILLVMLSNAVDSFEGGNGKITVSVKKADEDVILSVADTGMGMTPEIQEQALEPFFTTKEPGLGTGLGLPIVANLLKRVGAKLSIKSAPAAGSTFSLHLSSTPSGQMSSS